MQKPRVHLRCGDGGTVGKKRGAVGSGRALQGPLGVMAAFLKALEPGSWRQEQDTWGQGAEGKKPVNTVWPCMGGGLWEMGAVPTPLSPGDPKGQ